VPSGKLLAASKHVPCFACLSLPGLSSLPPALSDFATSVKTDGKTSHVTLSLYTCASVPRGVPFNYGVRMSLRRAKAACNSQASPTRASGIVSRSTVQRPAAACTRISARALAFCGWVRALLV